MKRGLTAVPVLLLFAACSADSVVQPQTETEQEPPRIIQVPDATSAAFGLAMADLSTGAQLIGTFDPGTEQAPFGIDFNRELGEVYVTDARTGLLRVFDLEFNFLRTIEMGDPGFYYGFGVLSDPVSDDIFISSYSTHGNRVLRFDAMGNFLSDIPVPGYSLDLTLNPLTNTLFVTVWTTPLFSVQEYTLDGELLSEFSIPTMPQIIGIAFDAASQSLFIAENDNDRVVEFALDGTLIGEFLPPAAVPFNGLGIDYDCVTGNLYYAGNDTELIHVYNDPSRPTCAADSDWDGDGIFGAFDNCPFTPNADQADLDEDGEGDVCDDDLDGDGVANAEDLFPGDPTEWADADADGIGDDADPDDDNDLQIDLDELACGSDPLDAGSMSPDYDGDDSPDCVDHDDDNDGVPDADDLLPTSNLAPTVVIAGCSSGVNNQTLSNGANFMDLIGLAAASAKNDGQFVSAVTQMANDWKKAGLISGRDKASITACAGG